MGPRVVSIRTRNDAFQSLQVLLANRTKRRRAGTFVVQGVRPIGMAISADWAVEGLICDPEARRSAWAAGVLETTAYATRYHLQGELLAELSQRDEPSELLALVRIRLAQLDDLLEAPGPLIALDRPGNPGNVGSILRSADALGAAGLVVIGHAVDPFDPQCVRASTGSIFSVPIVEVPSVEHLCEAHQRSGRRLVAADEHGAAVDEVDLAGTCTILLGSETRGLSKRALAGCDRIAAIPMSGTASSLNLAASATVMMYEAARQRRA